MLAFYKKTLQKYSVSLLYANNTLVVLPNRCDINGIKKKEYAIKFRVVTRC